MIFCHINITPINIAFNCNSGSDVDQLWLILEEKVYLNCGTPVSEFYKMLYEIFAEGSCMRDVAWWIHSGIMPLYTM